MHGFLARLGCVMLSPMDWDDLRYVLAVWRAGNLSAAGEALGVARTTVGRRLRAMESGLGVRLFDATPDGFVPTAAGEEFAQTALDVEAQILRTRGRLLGQDTELEGRVRISTLGFVYDGFLDVFTEFMERYPRIDLTICVTTRQVSLLRREADVALRLNNTPPERLIGRRLGTMEFGPYAHRDLVRRLGDDPHLGAFPWIDEDERSPTPWLQQWLNVHAPGARITLRTDDYFATRRSILAGLGAGFLPCFEAQAYPELALVGPRLDGEKRGLWALTLPELRRNSRVRALMEHLHDAFRVRRETLAGRPTSSED